MEILKILGNMIISIFLERANPKKKTLLSFFF